MITRRLSWSSVTWKDGALAHLPSGKFNANAAWTVLAVLAHNLGRWTLAAAGGGWAGATVGTLRRKVVSMPGRLVCSGRRLRLRAPANWRWGPALARALSVIAAIPPDRSAAPFPVRHDPTHTRRRPRPARQPAPKRQKSG